MASSQAAWRSWDTYARIASTLVPIWPSMSSAYWNRAIGAHTSYPRTSSGAGMGWSPASWKNSDCAIHNASVVSWCTIRCSTSSSLSWGR